MWSLIVYVELTVYVAFDDVPSVDSLIAGADPTGGGGVEGG